MRLDPRPRPSAPALAAALLAAALLAPEARAGGRPGRPVLPRAYVPVGALPDPNATVHTGLGTFVPTPYMMVRGNAPVGGGYSPLGTYGAGTLALYGPLSPLRPYAAPVVTYQRGYDGLVRPTVGTSFSTPNLPSLTPVVYPTWGTNAYGPARTTTPPWWNSGIMWIDQN